MQAGDCAVHGIPGFIRRNRVYAHSFAPWKLW
jgi:hypothetical protein